MNVGSVQFSGKAYLYANGNSLGIRVGTSNNYKYFIIGDDGHIYVGGTKLC